MKDSKPFFIPYSKGGLTKLTLQFASNLEKFSHKMGSLIKKSGHDEAAPLNQKLCCFNKKGRIDYALHEGVLENSYLSAIKAHVCYWNEQDIASFILQLINEQD